MSNVETAYHRRSRARLLILADDLTGTADSAVNCSTAGLATTVLLSDETTHFSEVVTIDTDSRGCSSSEAARRHHECLSRWQHHYDHLYKKMDSTLRGNVGAELAALIPLAGMAIVAPAFPATGRTTHGGRQYLDGQPVEIGEIWTNENLTGQANLVTMCESIGLRTTLLSLEALHQPIESVTKTLTHWQNEGIQVVICDAVIQNDLVHLAQASKALSNVFWAGSAGLGQALPPALGLLPPVADGRFSSPANPAPGPALFVIGSMSAVSHQQADALQMVAAHHLTTVPVSAASLSDTQNLSADNMLYRQIERALLSGKDVLVRLVQEENRRASEGVALSERLGSLLAPLLTHATCLIATGGATARAILIAADLRELTLLDAPGTGMARMQTTGTPSLEVITKAGGFGERDALARFWQARRSTLTPTTTSLSGIAHMTDRPVIGITMGDAAGVGPEIIVKSLTHDEVYRQCRPLVIGDAARLRDAASRIGSAIEIRAIKTPDQAGFTPGIIDCIDLDLIPADLPYGAVSPIAGDAAYQYIARTVALTQQGQLDAICTAPLNKAALHAGGHLFPGHTELLAHLTGIEEVSMMLVTPKMKVIHVTTHLGIIDAISRIEPGLVQRTIERAHATLVRAGIDNPRIAVCGINPHAGENGLFGYGEEEEKIMPAINALRSRGWSVEGPLPADTLFFRAGRGDFDCVVAMYHDQGHGPVKVMGLEAGVNVTVGLPVIRTSVDHGTAFDIAGQGLADERSMLEALRQAVELASHQDTRAVK